MNYYYVIVHHTKDLQIKVIFSYKIYFLNKLLYNSSPKKSLYKSVLKCFEKMFVFKMTNYYFNVYPTKYLLVMVIISSKISFLN